MKHYSVVIPARDAASSIGATLDSVLAQSLPPSEVIVVDDASEDGTADIAAAYQHVRVVRHERSRGPASARNSGIALARSDWIAFVDGDDLWDAGKLEQQAALAGTGGCGLLYCGIRQVGGFERRTSVIPAERFATHTALRRTLLWRNCVTGSASAVVVRRALLGRVGGFDDRLGVSEDWDCWIRLATVTEFAAVVEPLVTVIKRPGSLGGDPERMYQGELTVIAKHRAMFGEFRDGALLLRRAYARRFESRAKLYLRLNDRDRARHEFARSARLWPFRLETLVPLAKLCLGRS